MKSIVKNLLYAVTDPDETGRNNATRALGALAGYANHHPKLEIKIDASPFIAMLNSIAWTDRNKAGFLLEGLTVARDKRLLNEIRKTALPALM